MNSLLPSFRSELKRKFPDIVTFDVCMATLSHWRIGGSVSALITPRTKEELAHVRAWIENQKLNSLVIGNTTNLLFADEGVNAIIIKLGSNFSAIRIKGQEIVAQSGVYVPCLARKSLQQGLTGLEHIVGIPGTLGGLVYMNGGSQRKSIGKVITYIEAMDRTGQVTCYNANECGFSYRTSIFQCMDHLITEVGMTLELSKNRAEVHKEMLHILRERSRKFPRKLPNCGSVFISNPAMYEKFGPPGKVIEECGLKGMEYGGAQISPVHANFIINNGGATAKDVLYLINMVRDKVFNKTGYLMRVEARLVSHTGAIREI